MRELMHNKTQEQVEDEGRSLMTERNEKADQLIEKWSKVRGLDLGDSLTEMAQDQPEKARNFALVLENEQKHLKRLTETQISDTFSTTPSNVMRVIRLGYPNSVRSEVFREFSMQRMKETVYKLSPSYSKSKRGATAGENIHEHDYTSYASEMTEDVIATSATDTFDQDGTALTVAPIRPWTVRVYLNNEQVATDNGSGNLIGGALSTSTPSTIDYDTGDYTLVFASALSATDDLIFQYGYNMEDEDLYLQEGGETELLLKPHEFRAHPYPIGFSFSHMAELLAEDALQVDAQEALVSGGADALKKALDYLPLKLAMRSAGWTAPVSFNTDFAAAGSDSDWAHAQALSGAIEQAGDKMYEALNRGGVSVIVGGPKAITYLKKHQLYRPTGQQPQVGAHRVGELDGKPVYKVPSDIIPTDEILTLFKNDREDSLDVPIAIGTYIPLYRTNVTEYNTFVKKGAMAHYGDVRLMEKRYMAKVKLDGLN